MGARFGDDLTRLVRLSRLLVLLLNAHAFYDDRIRLGGCGKDFSLFALVFAGNNKYVIIDFYVHCFFLLTNYSTSGAREIIFM